MPFSDQASYLWVTDRFRAVAFLLALACALVAMALFETFGARFVLARIGLSPAGGYAAEWVTLPSIVAKARSSGDDIVLLLGGSTSRELSPSDIYMSRELSNRCNRSIRFVNAGTSAQVVAESWSLTEAAGLENVKLVVIGTNNLRMEEGWHEVSRSFAGLRLPYGGTASLFSTLVMKGEMPRLPFPPLAGSAWLARNADRFLWTGNISEDEYLRITYGGDDFVTGNNRYRSPVMSDEKKLSRIGRLLSERLILYDTLHEQGATVWAEYVRRFASDRPVVFLTLPTSSLLKPYIERTRDAMESDLSVIRDAGGIVAPLAGSGHLTEEDFYDQEHLVDSGRRKIAVPFVEQLAALLPGCGDS